MQAKLNLICVLILLVNQSYSAHWWLKGNSNVLTNDNYKQQIGQGKYHHIVKYFTPWCMYCQQMAGEWNKLADHYNKITEEKEKAGETQGLIKVSKINCEDNREMCQQYGVYSFPTIHFFSKDSKTVHGVFNNYRNFQALSDFSEEQMKLAQANEQQLKQQAKQQEQERIEKEKAEELEKQKLIESIEKGEIEPSDIENMHETEEKLRKEIEQREKKYEEEEKNRTQQQHQEQENIKKQQDNGQQENESLKSAYQNELAQVQKLTQELAESRQKNNVLEMEQVNIITKMAEFYREVNEIKNELHQFRLMETSQSRETLTTLNDYIFQETEQQQNLHKAHKNIKLLKTQLFGDNQTENQKQEENANDQINQNVENQEINGDDIYQHLSSNQIFVFGMTGIFLGFVIGFMSHRNQPVKKQHKEKQQYTEMDSSSHSLPVSDKQQHNSDLY